jgi:hypothetical protein
MVSNKYLHFMFKLMLIIVIHIGLIKQNKYISDMIIRIIILLLFSAIVNIKCN